MRRIRVVSAVVVALCILLTAACGGQQPASQEFESFDSGNFANPTHVDNAWFPLEPGTQFVYEGFTNDDNGNRISRRLVVIITDLTKVIGGVRSMVSWDRDYNADKLVEAELAFYAQDNSGTVWRMGEHPEEYEEGKFITAPTWIHGIENATAGIEMLAEPKLEAPDYSQGWAPAVDFTDRGQVSQVGQKVCVAAACYEDVLVIDETSTSEPDAHQLKFYAPDVGNIKVNWKGADQTQETLELVEVTQLSPEDLAAARAEALKEEMHAYEVSETYRKTSPAEYPEGTPAIDVSAIVVAEPTKAPSGVQGSASDIIVYASDLTQADLAELDFYDDPASPGGKWIGLPNNGDELDPPPENDPHLTFTVQVQKDVPYRCWIHMKVGAPKGKSQANVIWAQLSNAYDETKQEVLQPGSGSYLTAEGPSQEGWKWVECDRADSDVDSLVYFGITGEVTVRLQAGAEGVGFDQFLLSPEKYLETSPSEAIVEK